MKLLYIVTKGTDDATLASVPLHIAANGSLEIGQEVSVVLAGDATGGDVPVSIDAGRRVKRWRSPSRQTGVVSVASLSSFPCSPNLLKRVFSAVGMHHPG
jgi:hypothetical protein